MSHGWLKNGRDYGVEESTGSRAEGHASVPVTEWIRIWGSLSHRHTRPTSSTKAMDTVSLTSPAGIRGIWLA